MKIRYSPSLSRSSSSTLFSPKDLLGVSHAYIHPHIDWSKLADYLVLSYEQWAMIFMNQCTSFLTSSIVSARWKVLIYMSTKCINNPIYKIYKPIILSENFVHEMSILICVYYKFCVQNVLTFFCPLYFLCTKCPHFFVRFISIWKF